MGKVMVMCRSCGEFITALQDGGDIEPLEDECPDCGGTEFKYNDTGEVINVD